MGNRLRLRHLVTSPYVFETRDARDLAPIASDQCCFPGAIPSFDLAFHRERFDARRKVLAEDECDGTAPVRVAGSYKAVLVLRDASFEIVRVPHVEASISTAQHVPRTTSSRPCVKSRDPRSPSTGLRANGPEERLRSRSPSTRLRANGLAFHF